MYVANVWRQKTCKHCNYVQCVRSSCSLPEPVIALAAMAELLFKDSRDYILLEYELRRARRPSYSMRAFARDLGFSPSSLNDFIKSRVGMSKERIEKISAALQWSPLRKEHFLDLILSKYDKDPGVRRAASIRAKVRTKEGTYGQSLEAFKSISEWYHLVIIEICDIRDFVSATEVSKDLGISLLLATQAIKRLIKLGFLEETLQGLKPSDESSYFGSDSSDEALRNFHSQVLSLAQKALEEKTPADRESQSLVFSMDRGETSAMHEEIRKSIISIVSRYAQTSQRNSVQMLCLQVFPVLQKETL